MQKVHDRWIHAMTSYFSVARNCVQLSKHDRRITDLSKAVRAFACATADCISACPLFS